MATLKETKARIASVRSTLKITSAMKLVASAKLRKAQQAAENCAAYERELAAILDAISVSGFAPLEGSSVRTDAPAPKVAVVALSSNSSLCGGFNNNVIKKARSVVDEIGPDGVVLFAIGRKIADSFAKTSLKSVRDFTELSAHPSYTKPPPSPTNLRKDTGPVASRRSSLSGITLSLPPPRSLSSRPIYLSRPTPPMVILPIAFPQIPGSLTQSPLTICWLIT